MTFKPLSTLLCLCAVGTILTTLPARADEPGVATKVETAVEHGAHATANGVEKGAKAAANGIEKGAHAAEHGVKRGVQAAAEGVQRAANATARAADHVAEKMGDSKTPKKD